MIETISNIKALVLSSLLIIGCFFMSCNSVVETNKVSIDGRQILVDDTIYSIKGVCYHPVPKGSEDRNFSNLSTDLELMLEAGINTIRVYSPIDNMDVLDQINKAGIKIIMGFGYNQNGKYDIRSNSYIDYVQKYKDHEAILLWELGNEFNYHPEWFENDIQNWYTALNEAAAQIHQIDPSHPVSTSHGELPDPSVIATCSNIDVWGLNVYRWDNPETIFSEWRAESKKPMYISEAGADSYMSMANNGYEQGPNEEAQADATKNILDDIFKHSSICSGITLYAFVDEWWKAGNNSEQDSGGFAPNSSGVPYDGTANEEYWGIVSIDRKKKKSFTVVQDKFTHLVKK